MHRADVRARSHGCIRAEGATGRIKAASSRANPTVIPGTLDKGQASN